MNGVVEGIAAGLLFTMILIGYFEYGRYTGRNRRK